MRGEVVSKGVRGQSGRHSPGAAFAVEVQSARSGAHLAEHPFTANRLEVIRTVDQNLQIVDSAGSPGVMRPVKFVQVSWHGSADVLRRVDDACCGSSGMLVQTEDDTHSREVWQS